MNDPEFDSNRSRVRRHPVWIGGLVVVGLLLLFAAAAFLLPISVDDASTSIPNIWMWWDPTTKENNPFAQSYQYPRYPLHALAEYMRLGFAAERDATQEKPGVDRLIVITNANDESINNGVVAQFEELWQLHGEEYMRSYQFEKNLGLPHDVITPTREDGNVALTYPIIIDYITGAEE